MSDRDGGACGKTAHMKVLAISGSLRVASLNSLLLRAIARVAPEDLAVEVYAGLGTLPLFNPDLEAALPAPVADLRDRIRSSAAVLIASPEYAHGVSGPMKNALDWMVGNDSFVNKPVAVLNTSPRATLARAALLETLIAMSARIAYDACITIPLLGSGFSEEEVVGKRETVRNLREVLLGLRSLAGSGTSSLLTQ
jgi:chromate reductase, NAD(P)H dehydrogenase (quinone)